MKLLADVGLLGFPNAGKSTLIARISAARPKIAEYPFTTLTPHLGVVELPNDTTCVVADIPGLIPGAHTGKGLGLQFLKHLERTRLLVHLLDLSAKEAGRSPWGDFVALNHELACFSPNLAQTPQILVATKMDLPEVQQRFAGGPACFATHGHEIFPISAATGAGIDVLLVPPGVAAIPGNGGDVSTPDLATPGYQSRQWSVAGAPGRLTRGGGYAARPATRHPPPSGTRRLAGVVRGDCPGDTDAGQRRIPNTITYQQAAAAIGQSRLIWTYERLFGAYNQRMAQMLLTHEDLRNRVRYLNARNTLLTLLRYGVIPIINENDTVSVAEIRFGDNDTLAAMLCNFD